MSDDSEPAPALAPLDWADARAVQETAALVKAEGCEPIEAAVALLAGALREGERLRQRLLGVESAAPLDDGSPDLSDKPPAVTPGAD